MHCPFCNHADTQVMETRELEGGDSIRRRRRCAGCDRRFTTYERIELSMPDVLKSDGRRVPYERSKLEYSMKLALRKRPVSEEALDNALDQVETRLFKLGVREIPSNTIGEHVMRVLRDLDTVAYIRFASVYRQFEDIEAFADAIQEIGARAPEGMPAGEGVPAPSPTPVPPGAAIASRAEALSRTGSASRGGAASQGDTSPRGETVLRTETTPRAENTARAASVPESRVARAGHSSRKR